MIGNEPDGGWPPPRPVASRYPAGTDLAHAGYVVLFALIAAVLLLGLLYALNRPPEEDSVLLRQLTPRPRPTSLFGPAPAANLANSGSGSVAVLTVTPSPTAGASAEAAPAATTTGQPPASPSATRTVPPGTPTAGPSPTLPPGTRVHVVAPDDTLFQLALRYGTTVEAIMAANDIERRTDPIRVGARLIIPPR